MKHVCTALLLAAVCLVGCKNDPVAAPPAGHVDLLPPHAYPQVVATGNLAKWLRFGAPVVDHAQQGRPLQVNIAVRSIYDKHPVNVQYRFEFLDGEQRAVHGSDGWQFANLEPRVESQFSGGALDVNAVDWRLIVRPAR